MALTYPLSLAAFAQALKVESITFDLSASVEQKTNGRGEILVAEYGERYWFGTVTLAYQTWAEHEDAMALIRALQRPGAAFLATPLHRKGPANGTVEAFTGDRKGIRLNGLPANLALPRGTFVSWSNSGVRHLHQLVEATTADGTGRTGVPEVVPTVQASAVAGAAAELIAPACKAVLVPGSVRPATIRRVIAEGVAFDWRQTKL